MRVLLFASVAALASALLPSEATALQVSTLTVARDGSSLTDVDLMSLVNRAACACDEKVDITIGFTDRSTGVAGDVVIAVGTGCIDADGRLDDGCTAVWREPSSSVDGAEELTLSLEALAGGSCSARTTTQKLVVLVDALNDNNWTSIHEKSFGIDLERPTAPTGEKVVPGEGLVEVAFSDEDAAAGTRYQVLCHLDGEAVFTSPPDAAFESEVDRCGVATSTAGPRAAYVCAKAKDDTSSVTIKELKDGKTYTFEVVAIDAAGNASTVVRIGDATPAPEEDLWERYKRSGGSADGGNCFVATAAYGDYDDPTVRWLRVFRDVVLEPTAAGRAWIDLYYEHSPAAADRIATHPVLRAASRSILDDVRLFVVAVMTQPGGSR